MRALGISSLALRDTNRAHSPTVIRSLHRDDVLLAGDQARHLNGTLDGLGARRPEEERVEGGVGHHGDELLDELQVWLVVRDAALHNTLTAL